MKTIATITCTPFADGFYELPVEVDLEKALASGDPKGYILHEVARHLAGCVTNTGIPLHEHMWHVSFTKWARKHLNAPKGFTA